MVNNRRRLGLLVTMIIVACIIMAIVDSVIAPPYFIKSMIKLGVFLILPFIYSFIDSDLSLSILFKVEPKKIGKSILLGLGLYGFILGAYFILRPFIDLSNITSQLEETLNINKDNFIFVSLYISFINSLLEEFFFRGFAFLTLKRLSSRRFAYIFSSLAFSLYHAAFTINWVAWPLFILLLVSLFVAGFIFNYLNEKNETIYSSWIVHMFANFAINTIGFILFGVI